jgi:uncharacterized protein (TIGR00288 family)
MAKDDVPTMAIFCDFENVALGVRDVRGQSKFDIHKVLERLLSRGTIVVKKAYADWERYREYKKEMHRANFELIEVPVLSQSGKNSADIRMVVDALDLCYTKEHVSTFVLVSGDSDFSPLVSKLRENNKKVVGVGVRNSTSDLLVSNCDEFIFYDDLIADAPRAKKAAAKPRDKDAKAEPTVSAPTAVAAAVTSTGTAPRSGGRRSDVPAPVDAEDAPAAAGRPGKGGRGKAAQSKKAQIEFTSLAPVPAAAEPAESAPAGDPMELVLETLDDIFADRSDTEVVWASMLKQSLKRRRPEFNEKRYGFRTFGHMLETAAEKGLLDIEKDAKSGNYRILGFGPNG